METEEFKAKKLAGHDKTPIEAIAMVRVPEGGFMLVTKREETEHREIFSTLNELVENAHAILDYWLDQ